MQIIYRAISTDFIHRSGYLKKQAKTEAVTYIQRFGRALNLNIHFHMLFLEGVITEERGQTKFKRTKAPSHNYRIAVGLDAGKKVFSLQTIPAKRSQTLWAIAEKHDLHGEALLISSAD